MIAIQNARLFNETKEALARQTATADMLRVISSSPTDVQPVFDAIVATAVRLIGGAAGLVAPRRRQPSRWWRQPHRPGDGPSGLCAMPVDAGQLPVARACWTCSTLPLADAEIELSDDERAIRARSA